MSFEVSKGASTVRAEFSPAPPGIEAAILGVMFPYLNIVVTPGMLHGSMEVDEAFAAAGERAWICGEEAVWVWIAVLSVLAFLLPYKLYARCPNLQLLACDGSREHRRPRGLLVGPLFFLRVGW